MAAASLRAMIRIHCSTANKMEVCNEPALAAEFRALAQKYSDELQRREEPIE